MIIIGYQGIGKSTIARLNKNFIDLESGNFWVDGKRADDWYKPYCKIAEHLSQQGHYVFVSSHEVVRNELKKCFEPVICCIPTLELKEFWIKKLEQRFNQSKKDKYYKAWKNAEDRYEENIREIADSGFPIAWIEDEHYNLATKIIEVEFNLKG